jgi:hypothetical protein
LNLKYKDQVITPEEMRLLDQLLLEDPEYVDEAARITEVYIQLHKFEKKLPCIVRDEILSDALWQAQAADERQAPVFNSLKENSHSGTIQNVEQSKLNIPRKKLSMNSFVSILASAAAIIFLVLFARFAPPKSGYSVSTLTDSVGAKWADRDTGIQIGSRLNTGSRYLLKEGLAELLFDSEALITLEAPADFILLRDDQIKLNYGRLFANVPRPAIGFSVVTPNLQVIDLGTQFGVISGIDGSTETHVFHGEIALFAGLKNQKFSVIVKEGSAKRVDEQDNVSEIRLKKNMFAQKIDSSGGIVWRGEVLNLADIVGGGNGFGTGAIDMAIDPISGKPSSERSETREPANDYHPVPSSSYIDGVFVPNGQTPQVVSSQGHLFVECPVTNGSYTQNIRAFTNFDFLVLENVSDNQAQSPFLYLHANMGITFDLEAIRRSLPGVKIARFQSQCGIRKYADHSSASNADFWVLVDGTVRFKQQQVKMGGLYPIGIELSENDRFLTLVETDGGDPEGRVINGKVIKANDSDWGVFVDPILVLE